jgi:signal transduction histidine kinase
MMEDGQFAGVVGVVRNITERKEAEERLRGSRDQLRKLTSELTLVEEQERRRIAMGLHESIAQLLSLAKTKVDVVLDKEEDLGASQVKILRDIGDWLDKAITETKTLAFDLYPPILYTVGLEAALRNLAKRMSEQHGLLIEFENDGQRASLSEDMRILLYRVAEELLANTCQHAKARRAGLSVSREDDLITITVSDDGVGFDPATRANAGLGLFTVSERLRSVGGSFEIDSAPGKGTRAMLSVSLAAGKEPAAKEDRGTTDGATSKRKRETRA